MNRFPFLIAILFICFAAGVRAQSLQWENVLAPSAGAINCFAIDSSVVFAGAADSGVYRSSDNGASWTLVSDSSQMPSISALWADGSKLIAGTFFAGMFRSDNSGATWTQIATGSPDYVYTLFQYHGDVFVGTLDSGIYRTSDAGLNWQQVNNGIPLLNVHAFTAFGNILFAGTHGDSIYRSTDLGNNWTPSSTGLPEGFIHALALSGATLFVGTHYDGVYRSTDSGLTWKPASSGITNPYIIALEASGNSIFAAASDGLYLSTNMGDEWVRDMNDIPDSTTVLSIAISRGAVFAGTSSCGLYRAQLSGDAVSNYPANADYSLTVSPNPIASSSKIGYMLDQSGAVTIAIFDPLGREVARPVESQLQDAGEHEATIDAMNLAPGIYECRLAANGSESATRIVVLK